MGVTEIRSICRRKGLVLRLGRTSDLCFLGFRIGRVLFLRRELGGTEQDLVRRSSTLIVENDDSLLSFVSRLRFSIGICQRTVFTLRGGDSILPGVFGERWFVHVDQLQRVSRV